MEFQLFSPAPIHAELERARLAGALTFLAESVGGDHPFVTEILAGKSPAGRASELIAGSKLADPAVRRAISSGGPKAVENSDDAKANAQRSLDQATLKMTHINRAELAESTASTYQQANELINAAQRAMADQDYLAASSLAEKASALTSQLPAQR